METHPDAPATFTQRLTRGFIALAILLVLYVLSIGPAWFFFSSQFVTLTRNPNGSSLEVIDGPLAHFYMPVEWAAGATGLSPTLNVYRNWWIRLTERWDRK